MLHAERQQAEQQLLRRFALTSEAQYRLLYPVQHAVLPTSTGLALLIGSPLLSGRMECW